MDMMLKTPITARPQPGLCSAPVMAFRATSSPGGGDDVAALTSRPLRRKSSRPTRFWRSRQPRELILVAILLACSLCAHAEDPTADLIKKAQLVSRRGNVAETQAAYEKVLAARDLTVEQRVAAYLDIARVLQRGRKPLLKDALVEYEKALAIPSLPARERHQVLMGMAKVHYQSNYVDKRGSYHTRGIDAAMALYEEVAASDKVDGKTKVNAYSLKADCHFDRMDIAAAAEALKNAVALPGLSVEEKQTAEFNLARGFQRQLDYATARKMYDQLLAATKDVTLRNGIVKEYTKIFVAAGELDEGAKFLREAGRYEHDIADFLCRHGQKEQGVALYHKVLDDPKADDRVRWNAFSRLCRGGDFSQVMKLCDKYLDGFTKVDPKRVTVLLVFFSRGYMGPYYVGYDSRANPRFIVWVAGKLLPYEALSPKDRLRISSHLINAHLDLRNRPEAAAAAEAVAANETFKASEREQYKLIASVIDRKTEASKLKAAAEELLKTCRKEELPVVEQVESLEQVARVAVRALNHPGARTLDAVRDTLIKKEPRRSLNCEFVGKAPNDISSWLASPQINDKKRYGVIDRKYGNNLKNLLATDAAISGREVGTGDGQSAERARFSVVCDASAIHLFLLAPCKNAQDVADGLEATSSYEMYLAPGKNEPYYCYIVNPGQRSFYDQFHTMYKNRHYRESRIKDGTLFSESRPTEKGVATYIRVPWEVLHDKLPEQGDKYEFDVLYWADGGYSWGGSKSVHNRSSFGDLVFSNLTKENLNAIKRRIVKKAYDEYKTQKTGNKNGVIDFWEDPELGDPAFYNACLRKMIEELDNYGKLVKPGMTYDEVEMLYERAVPNWMEIEYVIADLRSKYLSDTFFAEEAD